VDASALSTVGIDVGGTKIAGARLDPGGVVAASLEVPTDLSSSDAILGQIAALVAELTADVEPVLGVGVGIPGTINQRDGRLLQAVNTPLADIAVRSRLEELTGLRVIIDNDANCAALGEHVHGAAGPLQPLDPADPRHRRGRGHGVRRACLPRRLRGGRRARAHRHRP
jgi:glucokinase